EWSGLNWFAAIVDRIWGTFFPMAHRQRTLDIVSTLFL
ncbi:MAG: hypothetical protein ACI956_000456, partial [Nonlabens sp.]